MNSIMITSIGNLVRDPEVKGNSNNITKIRIASTERVQDNGEWKDGDTTYIDVVCFSNLGQNARSLRKGDRVIVHGRLKYREFKRSDGSNGHDYEIVANDIGLSMTKASQLSRASNSSGNDSSTIVNKEGDRWE